MTSRSAMAASPGAATVSATVRVVSAVHELFLSEPALLENVLSFVAVPMVTNSEGDHDDNAGGEPQFDVDDRFVAIVSLSRAFPSLGLQLGPHNEGFWRSMVLRRFDFTVSVDDSFNAEIYDDEWEGRPFQQIDEEDDDDEKDSTVLDERNRQIRVAIRKYRAKYRRRKEDPTMVLDRDLKYWPSIGAHFRPAEYEFLSKIQSGAALLTTWPEHEDAYTLYRDLALMQDKLGKMTEFQVSSGNGDPVWPVFLGRCDGKAAGQTFELLRHCDYIPYFWDGTVDDRWTGLDLPLPPRVEDELVDKPSQTDEEYGLFPRTEYDADWRLFESLRALVHESFDDWRRVHGSTYEGSTNYFGSAEFFIGRSKASHRWLGFVGEAAE